MFRNASQSCKRRISYHIALNHFTCLTCCPSGTGKSLALFPPKYKSSAREEHPAAPSTVTYIQCQLFKASLCSFFVLNTHNCPPNLQVLVICEPRMFLQQLYLNNRTLCLYNLMQIRERELKVYVNPSRNRRGFP